jgi:hypothetical protein
MTSQPSVLQGERDSVRVHIIRLADIVQHAQGVGARGRSGPIPEKTTVCRSRPFPIPILRWLPDRAGIQAGWA